MHDDEDELDFDTTGVNPEEAVAAATGFIALLEYDPSLGALVPAYEAWAAGGPAVKDPESLYLQDISAASDNPVVRATFPHLYRSIVVERIGFTIPREEGIQALSDLGPVLEVGAGHGLVSALLSGRGVDIVATDPNPRPGFTPIIECDAEAAIREYPGRTVYCGWPELDAPWFARAVHAMDAGQVLAAVIEAPRGATADDAFYEMIGREIVDITPAGLVGVWSFPTMHDRLRVFRRT